MSGDEAALWRSQQKIFDQQAKLNAKMREGEQASRKAGDTAAASNSKAERSQRSLNQTLTDGVVKYASAASVASLAVKAISEAWKLVRKEQEDGLRALQKTQGSDAKLLQVSSSPAEFRDLTSQADSLSRATGVDRSVARDVLFSAVSEGFRDVVPELIAANQVLSPQSAAGVAGQVPALFKGQIEAMEAVSMTLKAAELSRLDFEPLAQSLPQAAEGGAIAKATPEETMATLSVLASRFKSGETAADRIKAFATRVGIDTGSADPEFEGRLMAERERAANAAKQLRAKEERVADLEKRLAGGNLSRAARPGVETDLARARRDASEFDRSKLDVVEPKRTKPTRASLQGMGIIKAVEQLSAMTKEQQQEFLGDSQELNTAFTILQEELPTIKKQEALLQQERAARAAGAGSLREKVGIANQDPQLQALRRQAIAQRSLELTQASVKGIEGAAASGAAAQSQADLLASEGLPTRVVGSLTGGTVASAAAASGASQDTATIIANQFARSLTNALMGNATVDARDMLDDVAKKMNQAADKLNARVLPAVEAQRAQAARANQ
jgi:hypothetical protein